jgi:hypothetical protein
LVVGPDGTGILDYYSVLTSSQGEFVLVEGHGTTAPMRRGQPRARVTVNFKTAAPRLAWLTKMIAAFESEADLSGGLSSNIFTGRYVEWS